MASTPRHKIRQTPTDIWSLRERLALACGVMRSGDLNWVSVNRAVKPFAEQGRPPEWFSQKNCALQYSDLLDKVETPKRKRGEREVREAPVDIIVRKLTIERIEELKRTIQEQQQRYKKLKRELELVQSGQADEQLKEIWGEIQKRKAAESAKAAENAPATPSQSQSQTVTALQKKKPSPGLRLDINAAIASSEVEENVAVVSEVSKAGTSTADASPIVTVTDDAAELVSVSGSPASVHLSSLLRDTSALADALQVQEEKSRLIMAEVQKQGVTGVVKLKEDGEADIVIPAVENTGEEVQIKTEPESNVEVSTSESQIASSEVKQEIIEEIQIEDFKIEVETGTEEEEIINEVICEEVVQEDDINLIEEINTDVLTETAVEIEGQGEEPEESDMATPATEEGDLTLPVEDDATYLEPEAMTPDIHVDVAGDLIDTDPPCSPASSVVSNETDGGSSVRGKGRRSRGGKLSRRGRRPGRNTRQRLVEDYERKESETSSKMSEVDSSDEDDEEPLLPGNAADDSLVDSSLKHALSGIESIPNSPASVTLGSDTEDEKAHKVWKKSIMLVWNAAAHHKYANVFRHPVSEDIAPGYHSVVSRPMDLLTIKKNIETGLIRSTSEFQRDIMLMFTNAIMYNNSDHDVFHMATEMYDDVMAHIEQFVNTEMMVHTEPKFLRTSRRLDASHSDKEDDPKKKKAPPPSDSEQLYNGGKAKKRRM